MSPNELNIKFVVGWDNPLKTFYLQRIDLNKDEDDEDRINPWIGTTPEELPTVEDLLIHMVPYFQLTEDIIEALNKEKEGVLLYAPFTLKQSILAPEPKNDNPYNNRLPSNRQFNRVYNQIERVLEFDERWKDMTETFRMATLRLHLPIGIFAKSFCAATSRKLIFLGTRFGTIAIYERWSNGENGIIFGAYPNRLQEFHFSFIQADVRMSLIQLQIILGHATKQKWDKENNLSTKLEGYAELFLNSGN